MIGNYFDNQSNEKYAKACLIFAKRIGLIDDDSLEASAKRCEDENAKRAKMIENGDVFYGLTHFEPFQYLQHELTQFKLDFVSESDRIKNYSFKEISKQDAKAYYKANKDLFTRYAGDKFYFREVVMIVKKKMREEEYDNEINKILCQL